MSDDKIIVTYNGEIISAKEVHFHKSLDPFDVNNQTYVSRKIGNEIACDILHYMSTTLNRSAKEETCWTTNN